MIKQYELTLPSFPRGFHLITDVFTSKLQDLPEYGLLNIFIKHTSAGLTLNENADPSVRLDMESIFSVLVPENEPFYTHEEEGPDDMPAHAKSVLAGSSVSIPITNGQLNLGTWQGIYLCEFRNKGGERNLVVTIYS
jgi:secondary thiamine-phosphate synthase enzyme